MKTSFSKNDSRAKSIFLAAMAFPAFLIITVILWELIIGVKLVSDWFADNGWRFFGVAFGGLAVALALALIVLTIWVFIAWIGYVARTIRISRAKENV